LSIAPQLNQANLDIGIAMVGRKRNFDESKQGDLVYCKTSNKEEGPPKKRHWTIVKFCFIPPEQSESPVAKGSEHVAHNPMQK
jgi:hypothetical protein